MEKVKSRSYQQSQELGGHKKKKGGYWMTLMTDPPKYVYIDSDGRRSRPAKSKTKRGLVFPGRKKPSKSPPKKTLYKK